MERLDPDDASASNGPRRTDTLMARAVAPSCAVLAVVYAFLTLSHPLGDWLVGHDRFPTLLMALPAATGVLVALLWVAVRRHPVAPRWAGAWIFGLGLIMTVNSTVFIRFVPEPEQTTNFLLIALSAGLIFLSRPWLLATLAVAGCGWWIGVSPADPAAGWIHWGAMLVLTQILALLVHEFRLRSTFRLIALRDLAEEHRLDADRALEAARRQLELRERAESELRLREKHLAEMQRRESLGLMAGGIAHDFNNLLTAIVGNAEIGKTAGDRASDQHFDAILQASEQAAQLCRQMLAYSGRAQIEKRVRDLGELVGEPLDLLAASLPKTTALDVRLAGAPEVEVDPTAVRQIIVNLITNASEALPEQGGTVSIEVTTEHLDEKSLAELAAREAARPGAFGVVRVKDSGVGMPESVLERVFDPFFTTKPSGTGLGLASALGIANAHGGALDIHSTPERGTTVALYLPVAKARAQQESPDPPIAPGAESRETILIVDDEDSVRRVVRRILEAAGHRVLEAGGASDALALDDATVASLDVALVDLSMPDGSGLGVAETLAERAPRLRVVVMSGYDRDDALRDHPAQRSDFLAKPFRAGELLRAVARPIA